MKDFQTETFILPAPEGYNEQQAYDYTINHKSVRFYEIEDLELVEVTPEEAAQYNWSNTIAYNVTLRLLPEPIAGTDQEEHEICYEIVKNMGRR